MSRSTVTLKAPRRSLRQPESLDRLASRVMAACTKSAQDNMGILPSERDLAKELSVTRHAVRSALEHLERRGVVRRLPGRASMAMNGATDAGAKPAMPLRCINFLYGRANQSPAIQWLNDEYLAGYTEVLDLYDIKTRFLFWDDDRRDFESMFWPMAPRSEQGCVLVNRRGPELLRYLNKQRIPHIVQNHAPYDESALPPHHRVYVNKMGAAFEATRKLLELGHRRIGFVGQLPSSTALWPEYEGMSAALRCAGLDVRKSDCVQLVTEELQHAFEPCRQLLARADRPTAVLGAHGAATRGLKEAAVALGIKVPEQLSIIGFTSPLTNDARDLSLVEVPRRELALRAIESLLRLALPDAEPPPATQVLECKIVLRDSVAAPSMFASV